MNGGSSAPYLACTPCVHLFCTLFNKGGNRWACRLPGAAGIISIVGWNLRPVIFSVEKPSGMQGVSVAGLQCQSSGREPRKW